MSVRWSRDQVLAVAPDASSRQAALGLAVPDRWVVSGANGENAVWGECKGSGKQPYRASADLSDPAGPAYRCNCPSRKFPCKHVLGLLLLWSSDDVPQTDQLPAWVGEWLASRRDRAEKARSKEARAPSGTGTRTTDPDAARKRAEQRARRVSDGLAELDRWLCDQVRLGIATAPSAGYAHWDGMARRLVDAQAQGVARRVTDAASIPGAGQGWAAELLTSYALMRLLVVAHRRAETLPAGLTAEVRRRIGFTLSRDSVLREGERVGDRWHVLGQYDEEDERLVMRTIWLHGAASGRAGLVLAYAPTGQPFDVAFVPGSVIDADLAFYPGASGLRALVAEQRPGGHRVPGQAGYPGAPAGTDVRGMLDRYAAALGSDPWLERWPVVLSGVCPGTSDGRWHLVDSKGESVPMVRHQAQPLKLVAVSGGHPMTVAGEWTPRGFRALTAWAADELDGPVVL